MEKRALIAVLLAVSAVLLPGCAATAEDYAGQPGAQVALAKCRVQADSLPSNTNAAANPMFAGAMQQQYMTDCMRAAGYQIR